jgi:hypothetical protein
MPNFNTMAAAVGGTGILIVIIVVLFILGVIGYMYMTKGEVKIPYIMDNYTDLTPGGNKDIWQFGSPFIGGQAITADAFDPLPRPLPPKNQFREEPFKGKLGRHAPKRGKDWFSDIPGYKVTAEGLVRDSFSDIPGYVITAQGLKPEGFANIPGYKITAQGLKPEQFAGIPGYKITAQGLKPENFNSYSAALAAPGLTTKYVTEGWKPTFESQYDNCDVTGGCPNVMRFLDGAYHRTYAASGLDESGNMFYEFYGPGRAFARAKYEKAFPGCPLPEVINY